MLWKWQMEGFKMILLVDNYDSFVYNVYQLIASINKDIRVIRNDECTIEQIKEMDPEIIILSPGPGKPSEAGRMEEIIQAFYTTKKMLGICLGHQAIAEVMGGEVIHAPRIMHGKQSMITTTQDPLFNGLPEQFKVARYHSLIADPITLSSQIEVIAKTDQDEIMAIKVKDYPVYGLQFHPESILTEYGKEMMENFLLNL